MSSISGVGAYPSATQLPGQPGRAKPVTHEQLSKADAPVSGPAQRPAAAKTATELTGAQPKDRQNPERPAAASRRSGASSEAAQAFESTTSRLQQRQLGQAEEAPQEADNAQNAQGTGTANAALQEKMQRQIIKMKDAYSHIQAHTGDTQAGAGMSLVV